MRFIAEVTKTELETKRLMIYGSKEGSYLFGFNILKDSHSNWDEWYATVSDAKELCEERFGIEQADWKEIPDPMEFCQHDWINPVRTKGVNTLTPDYEKFEKFENGKWIEI